MVATQYFFAPKADIFTPIATLIETETSLKSYLLEKSRNHEAQRFDWTPVPGEIGGPKMAGDSPRVLADADWRCEIRCRAQTYDGAWWMLQVVMSAIRRASKAQATFEGHSPEDTSDQPATLKSVVVFTVSWKAPLLEQPLEGSETERVTIQSVDFDKSAPNYGVDDDTLIAPLG